MRSGRVRARFCEAVPASRLPGTCPRATKLSSAKSGEGLCRNFADSRRTTGNHNSLALHKHSRLSRVTTLTPMPTIFTLLTCGSLNQLVAKVGA